MRCAASRGLRETADEDLVRSTKEQDIGETSQRVVAVSCSAPRENVAIGPIRYCDMTRYMDGSMALLLPTLWVSGRLDLRLGRNRVMKTWLCVGRRPRDRKRKQLAVAPGDAGLAERGRRCCGCGM